MKTLYPIAAAALLLVAGAAHAHEGDTELRHAEPAPRTARSGEHHEARAPRTMPAPRVRAPRVIAPRAMPAHLVHPAQLVSPRFARHAPVPRHVPPADRGVDHDVRWRFEVAREAEPMVDFSARFARAMSQANGYDDVKVHSAAVARAAQGFRQLVTSGATMPRVIGAWQELSRAERGLSHSLRGERFATAPYLRETWDGFRIAFAETGRLVLEVTHEPRRPREREVRAGERWSWRGADVPGEPEPVRHAPRRRSMRRAW